MKKLAILGILAITVFLSFSAANAQAQQAIRINQILTTETETEMRLKLYFNLYDPTTQKPITTIDTDNAHITLLDSGYDALGLIREPDVPIYVTLLLDSSGSMGGNAQNLANAAKLALNSMPDDALFGVVQFDEEIKLLQDFSDNIPAIQVAIDQYAVQDRGTCLYDAVYLAVEEQAKAPAGRRAVILFTDGKDEIQAGVVCSEHTIQEVIDLALQMHVPIHTIGLSGQNSNINEVELKNLADITGGFSFIASQVDLPAAFTQIMESLQAQWMVEAQVYPSQGQNEGVFSLVFEERDPLTAFFSFESGTDYPGPPSPVQARLDGLQLIAATQSYELQMTFTSPELIGYVKVALWDQDAGSKLTDYIFDNPTTFNSFIFPTDQLAADRKYELRISAVSAGENIPFSIVTDSRGETSTELVHEFQFDPSGFLASAEIASVTQADGDLQLKVSLTNPGMIGGFNGWLVDNETNTQVTNSEFTLPAGSAANGVMDIPMRENRIATGVYTVVLRVLDSNQQVVTTTQFEDVSYRAPGLFHRISQALTAEPLFLIAIIGIILGVIFFLMVGASRRKSITGTPVVQNQLGTAGKPDQKKQGIKAIAAEEPLDISHGRSSSHGSAQYAPMPPELASRETPKPSDTVLQGKLGPDAKPSIEVIRGPVFGEWTIGEFPYVIGRVDCDLTLNEPSVSRRHAQISRDEQYNYFITDLNSSNGTRLNDQLLAAGQKIILPSGSKIDLGKSVSLHFVLK